MLVLGLLRTLEKMNASDRLGSDTCCVAMLASHSLMVLAHRAEMRDEMGAGAGAGKDAKWGRNALGDECN